VNRIPDFTFLFARKNVDDFVAAKAHNLNKDQQVLAASRKRFNIYQSRPTKFYEFQQVPASGSGPGGRRFKSSLPDQYFL
jgi:hypothetical protein